MVVEAGFGNVAFGEIVIEILSGGIGGNVLAERAPEKWSKGSLEDAVRGEHQRKGFVFVDDLDAVLVFLRSRPVADCREMAVHGVGACWLDAAMV